MERTIGVEERIRRAEEIYNRRKMQGGVRVPTTKVNSREKVEYKLFKKMILQILICLVIYFIFYLIKNSNYIFSEDVINKTKEMLSHDINFQNLYNQAIVYYNDNLKSFFQIEEDKNGTTNNINNNEIQNEQSTNVLENGNNEISNEQLGVGGGEETNEVSEVSADEQKQEPKVELTQMEIDANEIKSNYNFILPLKGTVTSRYGPRTPTQIISANHAGIDVGVNEGTKFISAMEGTAILVSGEGSYGNHVYIQNGNVITVYAHCKTIYIKQGEYVKQGQEIGEVGQTGNATGPHLHFEVKKDGRTVNPEYILSF